MLLEVLHLVISAAAWAPDPGGVLSTLFSSSFLLFVFVCVTLDMVLRELQLLNGGVAF